MRESFTLFAQGLRLFLVLIIHSSTNRHESTYDSNPRMDILPFPVVSFRAKEPLHSSGVEESDRHYDL